MHATRFKLLFFKHAVIAKPLRTFARHALGLADEESRADREPCFAGISIHLIKNTPRIDTKAAWMPFVSAWIR